MKFHHIAVAVAFLLYPMTDVMAGSDDGPISGSGSLCEDIRSVMMLYDGNMLSRSRYLFDEISRSADNTDAYAYSVLCDIRMQVPGYSARMDTFIAAEPQSPYIPQMRLLHAFNLFERKEYASAYEQFAGIPVKRIRPDHIPEYLFKKACSAMETGKFDDAIEDFRTVEAMSLSDYTAPARYALGYACYNKSEFKEALVWFEKASSDGRFKGLAEFYMVECRFMLKDYDQVVKTGTALYPSVPKERKAHLSRLISESYLVLGDAGNARRFYDLGRLEDGHDDKSRSDWFYSGSVLYAVQDYKGAVDCFSMMGEMNDSIGQIASYHMGYSHIQLKDKVSAMAAFKQASSLSFDPDIAEDAYFNYAKLSFDLNNDASVFQDYLKIYSDLDKGDRIYSYIAVAALFNHDYEGAVEAYDKVDELDEGMKLNYMKANYLRANQLIRSGSYRKAVPCLKAAAWYSEKGSRFHQLSRFWLGEACYRNDQYAQARDIFTELYNTSALYGMPESGLVLYNIAYCYYKEADYPNALKWFSSYLGESSVLYRKEALERSADCHFMAKDYGKAAAGYELVLKDYHDVNDIYPYYQAAVSYGLVNDMDKKVELLSSVLKASPDAEFYPEALFELGRAYAVREDDEAAFDCFTALTETVRDSTYIAKAYIEMGSISRNQSQFNEALGYYKTVVEQMPMSEYAEDAMLAIEAVYQTQGRTDEYLAYIESIGRGNIKTEDEKEKMIFNSAEQIFLSENYQKALVALQSYLDRYPSGHDGYKAEFYMAESYRHLNKLEQACDCYRNVIAGGEGSFVELSMLNFSNLSYRLERWDDAYGGYSSLRSVARLGNNGFTALCGMMRSAYRSHDWNNAVKAAVEVIADSRSGTALRTEAEYIKAKSFLATSRRDEAYAVFEKLSADMESVYGAEAAYLVILDCYDRGEFDKVEEKVFAFSDSGTGQLYWLAKSFMVLGDSYVERDNISQAKATFTSIMESYEPESAEDDVKDNVRMRLERLEKIMSEE